MTKNETGATTTTYLVRDPELPMLKPLDGVLPQPVINQANAVLKPIVDRGYSRNDAANGNRMPYLQPTDGLPRLVRPPSAAQSAPKVRDSFKATPNALAPSLFDRSIRAIDRPASPNGSPFARLRERLRDSLAALTGRESPQHVEGSRALARDREPED